MRLSLSELFSMIFPLSIMAAGIFLTLRLQGLQFRRLGTAFRNTFGKAFRKGERGKGLSPFQASASALAGTLGTGNIAGVATALTVGGPGALFWMWVSAFLGMAVKYGEIVLAVYFQGRDKSDAPVGGPMFYIEKAFHSAGPAIFFAGSCVAASFGIGNLTQSGAASEAVSNAFGVPRGVIGLALAVLTFLAVTGGIKRIGFIAERLVPFMGAVYLGGAMAVLLPRLSELPAVFRMIFADAFSGEAMAGGVVGVLTGKALRIGVSRGIFTNEAGMGSAPIAHGAADAHSPAEEGLWGIVEVFLDTVVMCTLTGTVILLSGITGQSGAALTVAAFECFLGSKAAGFIAVSTCFFAFASILCWCCYGEAALRYLSAGEKTVFCYRLVYSLAVTAGAVFQLETVFRLSDTLNFLMSAPNLAAVVLLSHTVISETEKSFGNFHKKPSNSHKL